MLFSPLVQIEIVTFLVGTSFDYFFISEGTVTYLCEAFQLTAPVLGDEC